MKTIFRNFPNLLASFRLWTLPATKIFFLNEAKESLCFIDKFFLSRKIPKAPYLLAQ